MSTPLTDEIRAAPPLLHGGGNENWGLAWAAMSWLELHLRPEMSTLETGSGASTILFAAAGGRHDVVTPAAGEVELIRRECAARGISTDQVSFHMGRSEEVLPSLEPRPLDLVLIDGAHGFPYPILDWWYLAPRLKVGGALMVDDCYMPPVGALADFLLRSPSWELLATPGRRTVAFTKQSEEEPPSNWTGGRIGGRMGFRYLPPLARLRAATGHRVLESGLARRAAARARRRP
jgi:hypothetical protein